MPSKLHNLRNWRTDLNSWISVNYWHFFNFVFQSWLFKFNHSTRESSLNLQLKHLNIFQKYVPNVCIFNTHVHSENHTNVPKYTESYLLEKYGASWRREIAGSLRCLFGNILGPSSWTSKCRTNAAWTAGACLTSAVIYHAALQIFLRSERKEQSIMSLPNGVQCFHSTVGYFRID